MRLVAATLFLLLAGCVGAGPPAPDRFEDWSATPLAPDASLAERVLDAESVCQAVFADPPARVLIQDRRTARTAVFLLATDEELGTCGYTAGGG